MTLLPWHQCYRLALAHDVQGGDELGAVGLPLELERQVEGQRSVAAPVLVPDRSAVWTGWYLAVETGQPVWAYRLEAWLEY